MREIKFRGKTIEGEWVYGYYLVDEQHEKPRHCIWTRENVGDFIANDMIPVDPETVGQYTGLKDKNGRKIYKGDIVFADCCKKYLEVIWNDIGCGGWWFAEKIDGDMYCVGKIDLDWLEVKGNIHDNPELLEGDEGE